MLPIHTILHPTDFSERSEYAFHLAGALARDYHARLILMHAIALPVAAYGENVVVSEGESLYGESEAKIREMELPGSTVSIERMLLEGEPVATILRIAKENGVDLIVMGNHGRTGLRRLLMGSVAEQVVRRASCPVVTVKSAMHELVEPVATPAMEPQDDPLNLVLDA